MSVFYIPPCFKACNNNYSATDPARLFCKKGCSSDEDVNACKKDYCSKLCIKQELGDEEKKPGWSKFFARAPAQESSDGCLNACIFGCINKDEEQD